MKERVVIDINVWVAAFNSADGASREVFRLALCRECRSLVGQALLAEYEDVLGRSQLFAKPPLSQKERNTKSDEKPRGHEDTKRFPSEFNLVRAFVLSCFRVSINTYSTNIFKGRTLVSVLAAIGLRTAALRLPSFVP